MWGNRSRLSVAYKNNNNNSSNSNSNNSSSSNSNSNSNSNSTSSPGAYEISGTSSSHGVMKELANILRHRSHTNTNANGAGVSGVSPDVSFSPLSSSLSPPASSSILSSTLSTYSHDSNESFASERRGSVAGEDFDGMDFEYVENVKRLEEAFESYTSMDPRIQKIMDEDEETIVNDKDISPEQVQLEIDYLLGKRSTWSTEGEEVLNFRKKIRRAKEANQRINDAKGQLKPVYPPIYLTYEPLPPGFPDKFIAQFILGNDKMTRKVQCLASESAEQFTKRMMEQFNRTYNFGPAEDWVVKATGTAEFMYGPHRMVDFEHIRNCFKNNKEIGLTLVQLSTLGLGVTSGPISYIDPVPEEPPKIISLAEDKDVHWTKINAISMMEIMRPFRVKIVGVDILRISRRLTIEKQINPEEALLFVAADLYHGEDKITPGRVTEVIPFSQYPRWDQWLEFSDLFIAHLPRATRLVITVWAKNPSNPNATSLKDEQNPTPNEEKDFPIGGVNVQLIDFKGRLKTGAISLRMWPSEKANPIGTVSENQSTTDQAPIIGLVFDSYALPVMFTDTDSFPQRMVDDFTFEDRVDKAKLGLKIKQSEWANQLEYVLKQDPLFVMTDELKSLVWHHRDEIKNNPKALPKFLSSVKWRNPVAASIALKALDEWAELNPIDALELLDSNHAHPVVRAFAVKVLDKLSDNQVNDFILQLVQTLKYEPYLDSPLARFLLSRAVNSPHMIGHMFFWHLKSEMHLPHVRERNGLLLEEYLASCGAKHRRSLIKQNYVIEQLLITAIKIKKPESKKLGRVEVLRNELANIKLPKKFKLPLSPKFEVLGLEISKCKVMDSKKLPLWLVFKNADPTGKDIYIIFKAGDDLRQDQLTLQMFKIMDSLWKSQGLDLRIIPYGCISTGDGVGMIEVVLNSDTVANITFQFGGVSAVWSDKPLLHWLTNENPKENMPKVIDSFVRSCAGYCVATYVLGIGDRHNDNIMLTKSGNLFHIDFGHFLGNFKSKFGIKRETAPFVFTSMYAHVMGGEGSESYKEFQELSAKAFNTVRHHGHLFENLFRLMLSTGIPELTSAQDIMWLRKCLVFDYTDEQAEQRFNELIKESVANFKTKANEAIHIAVHKKASKKDKQDKKEKLKKIKKEKETLKKYATLKS